MAFKRQRMGRRKVCYFTKNKITYIDYKDVENFAVLFLREQKFFLAE